MSQKIARGKQIAAACVLGALLGTAEGQPADSTHVLGLAPQGVTPTVAPPSGGSSVQQLLNRMQGAELYFREYNDYRSGDAELPAFVRVKVFADRAELQFHQRQAGWQRQCSATPERTICGESQPNQANLMTLQLHADGFSLQTLPCSSWEEGQRTGSAHYSLAAFQAGVGAFSQRNRNLNVVNNGYQGFWFQNGSYQGMCSSASS